MRENSTSAADRRQLMAAVLFSAAVFCTVVLIVRLPQSTRPLSLWWALATAAVVGSLCAGGIALLGRAGKLTYTGQRLVAAVLAGVVTAAAILATTQQAEIGLVVVGCGLAALVMAGAIAWAAQDEIQSLFASKWEGEAPAEPHPADELPPHADSLPSVVCGSPDPHTQADRRSPRAGDGSATLGETCGRAAVARSETGHNTAPFLHTTRGEVSPGGSSGGPSPSPECDLNLVSETNSGASLPDHVDQTSSRYVADGRDHLETCLRVRFEPGQQTAIVHLPIQPAMNADPQVECEPCDGSDLRIAVDPAQPYGVRLVCRRPTPCTEAGETVLAVLISADRAAARAA